MLYSDASIPSVTDDMTRLLIKEVAEAQGMDIAKLSRRADLNYKTVWQLWTQPERDVTVSTLRKIADALGVSVRQLVEDTTPVQS